MAASNCTRAEDRVAVVLRRIREPERDLPVPLADVELALAPGAARPGMQRIERAGVALPARAAPPGDGAAVRHCGPPAPRGRCRPLSQGTPHRPAGSARSG